MINPRLDSSTVVDQAVDIPMTPPSDVHYRATDFSIGSLYIILLRSSFSYYHLENKTLLQNNKEKKNTIEPTE